MASRVGPSVFPATRGRLRGADRRPEAVSGGLRVPARHCGRGAPGTSLHPEAGPALPVRMGAPVCTQGETFLRPQGDPRCRGPHRLPLVLRGGSPPFGELSFCPCLWLRVSEILSKHVSALGAEEALDGHHTHPSVQSQPTALQSTLSRCHLVRKFTVMMAARARSPSEG